MKVDRRLSRLVYSHVSENQAMPTSDIDAESQRGHNSPTSVLYTDLCSKIGIGITELILIPTQLESYKRQVIYPYGMLQVYPTYNYTSHIYGIYSIPGSCILPGI